MSSSDGEILDYDKFEVHMERYVGDESFSLEEDSDEYEEEEDFASLYNSDLSDFSMAEYTIPDDMDKSIIEKLEIENEFWNISMENVDKISNRLLEFLKKKKSNQVFVIQLFDTVALAKPKLIKPLERVFSSIIDHIPIDKNMEWESPYFNNYLNELNKNSHKKFSSSAALFEKTEFLYPRDTYEYYAAWDDLDGLQKLELSREDIETVGGLLINIAARFASVKVFKYLVNSINIEITQETFNSAVQGGDLFIVRYCLNHNQDPLEPLDIAVRCNNFQLVEWMISEYNILPSFYAPLQRSNCKYFFPLLPRMNYVSSIDMIQAISSALKSGYEEIALYLLKNYHKLHHMSQSIILWMAVGAYEEFNSAFFDLPNFDIIFKHCVSGFFLPLADNNPELLGKYINHPKLTKYFDDIITLATTSFNIVLYLQKSGLKFQERFKELYHGEFYTVFYTNKENIKEIYSLKKSRPERAKVFNELIENTNNITEKEYNFILTKLIGYSYEFASCFLQNPKFKQFNERIVFDRLDLLYNFIYEHDIRSQFCLTTYPQEHLQFILDLSPHVDKFNPHKSPFHHKFKTRIDFYQILLKIIPNINIRNFRCQTVLHYHCGIKNYSFAQQIITEYKDININARNSKGVTPLMLLTIQYRNGKEYLLNLIKQMLIKGADPNIKSCKGVSSVDIAKNNRRKEDLIELFANYSSKF